LKGSGRFINHVHHVLKGSGRFDNHLKDTEVKTINEKTDRKFKQQ
jgi:hypothetical protein